MIRMTTFVPLHVSIHNILTVNEWDECVQESMDNRRGGRKLELRWIIVLRAISKGQGTATIARRAENEGRWSRFIKRIIII